MHRKLEHRPTRIVLWIAVIVALVVSPAAAIGVVLAEGGVRAEVLEAVITVAGSVGIFAFLAIIWMALLRRPLLTAKKLDRNFVWLEKVDAEYLQQFPELPTA